MRKRVQLPKSKLVLTAKTNKKVKYHTTETVKKKSTKADYSQIKYSNNPAKDREFVKQRMKEEILRSVNITASPEVAIIKVYLEGALFAFSMISLIQVEDGEEPLEHPEIVSVVQTEQVS